MKRVKRLLDLVMDRVVKETKREAQEGVRVQRGFSTREYIWTSAGMCWTVTAN